MSLRLRILKLVSPTNRGPQKRTILEGQARTPREKANAEQTVADMIERGELAKYGDKRGAKYGLPKVRQ